MCITHLCTISLLLSSQLFYFITILKLLLSQPMIFLPLTLWFYSTIPQGEGEGERAAAWCLAAWQIQTTTHWLPPCFHFPVIHGSLHSVTQLLIKQDHDTSVLSIEQKKLTKRTFTLYGKSPTLIFSNDSSLFLLYSNSRQPENKMSRRKYLVKNEVVFWNILTKAFKNVIQNQPGS